MKQALLAALAAILVLSLSCQKSTDSSPTESDNSPPIQEVLDAKDSANLLIRDDQGLPLPGARVLIGDQESTQNPWLTADEKGLIPIPETWISPADVTISMAGFIQLTLKDQSPFPLHLTLRKKSQVPYLALKGNISGMSTKDKDGWIDFSVVLESMSKIDMLNFNINKVISPWSEKISAIGMEFPVPQNLFLPKQKESYFISITLQKPWFTLNSDSYGTKSLFALTGKFPMKKMLSERQNNKAYFELVNAFDFYSAGRLSYDFSSANVTPNIDSTQIKLDQNLSTIGPKLIDGQVTFAISTFKENGFYQPLDIKYIQSEQSVSFKSASSTATPYMIGVIKNKNEFDGDSAQTERMSISIDVPKASISALPLMKDPSWSSTSEIVIDAPTVSTTEFADRGMLVVVSDIQEITLPDGKTIKYKLPVWEIYVPRWSNRLVVPNANPSVSAKKRVEVTLMAKNTDNSGQQNSVTLPSTHEDRIEDATHITKSALDY